MNYSYIEALPRLVESKCDQLIEADGVLVDRRIFESGKRVISHAINKALDRRTALGTGLAALKSFSTTNRDALAQVKALAMIKTILHLDNIDSNQLSLPVIFNIRSSKSAFNMWAHKMGVSPKLMKKFVLSEDVKSLLTESENHYNDLYHEFLALRNEMGASDDSSSIHSSSNGKLLRVDWASNQSFLSLCMGQEVTPKVAFPLSESSWLQFFHKHCTLGVVAPTPKKKVAWTEDIVGKENQRPAPRITNAPSTGCAAAKMMKKLASSKRAILLKNLVADLSKDDIAKEKKMGGVYKCGIAYKTKKGTKNPYFKQLFKNKLKQAEKEANEIAAGGN